MIRHLGSSLTDVTYVFDEPTIGLHPHDIARMNDLLLQLRRERGTTLVLATHDLTLASRCDTVVRLRDGQVVEVQELGAVANSDETLAEINRLR